jgi:hypothetical protein
MFFNFLLLNLILALQSFNHIFLVEFISDLEPRRAYIGLECVFLRQEIANDFFAFFDSLTCIVIELFMAVERCVFGPAKTAVHTGLRLVHDRLGGFVNFRLLMVGYH